MRADATPRPAPDLKIPYDSMTLRAVTLELQSRLTGGQIQEVRQPEPTEVLLGIRSQGRNYTLVLSADPQFARVHITTQRRANPPTPPAFCMLLRKYIENALILDIRQRGFDRILEIEIGTRVGGESIPHVVLIAELMGKHSNLILTTREGTILDAAKRITHRINRLRETLPGLLYTSPPAQDDRVDPFAPDAPAFFIREVGNASPELRTLSDTLLNLFSGLSPFLAGEIASRILSELPSRSLSEATAHAWQNVFDRADAGRFAPVLVRNAGGVALGAYPLPLAQISDEQQKPIPELNAALDLAFTGQRDRARLAALTGEIRGKLEAEIKRVEKQQASLARTLEEAERSEAYKQAGELILANVWQMKPGMREVTVTDYFDPAYPERTLPLDPTLSPQENAEAAFRRYRKARAGAESAKQQRETLNASHYRLLAARDRLNELRTEEELRTFRGELAESGLLRAISDASQNGNNKRESEFAGHKIRRYATPEGYEILVGESATANDYLTLRVAHTNDLWLHVRAAVSAHVVIRTQGKPEHVPRSVLQRAAQLCIQHSQQKHSSLVSVDYTLKKYVRKPRGSAPGAADYTNETTIDVST